MTPLVAVVLAIAIVAAGLRLHDRLTIRRGLQRADDYLRHPELRHVIDHFDQPRKEETP
ncbi:hypothetical protein [Streptomyces sp. NRRL S-813]|uniref:hypothetical protein n=1 Tax=Streptomyces sp. NRRL S-813 TaxID=1463919 RepID=UPI000B306486|nr:hypothetical protein [Streptomyces sp. NRRL S-813]